MRVAALGVKIDSAGAKSGAAETNSALDSIGAKATATSQKVAQASSALAGATKSTTLSIFDQIKAIEAQERAQNKAANEARRAAQAQAELARAEAIVTARTNEQAAATSKVGLAALTSEAGLNRLRGSLTGLLTPILGTIGSGNALVSTLGSLALGSGVTVGVLAGVAAFGVAYDKLTEKTQKLKKETLDAIKELEQLAKKERQGTTGDLPENIAKAEAELRTKRAERAALASALESPGSSGDAAADALSKVIFQKRADSLKEGYKKLDEEIAAGERKLRTLMNEINRGYESDQGAQLASLVSSNAATIAEQTRARDALKNLQGQLAENLRLGGDPAERVRLISDIKALNDALNPKPTTEAKKEAKELAKALEEMRNSFFNSGVVAEKNRLELAKLIKPIDDSKAALSLFVKEQSHAADVAEDHARAVRLGIADTVEYRAAQEVAAYVEKNHIVITEANTKALQEYQQAVERRIAAEDAANGKSKQSADVLAAMEKHTGALANVLGGDLLSSIERVSSGGITSFRSLFSEVSSLSIRMVQQIGRAITQLNEDLAKAQKAGDTAAIARIQAETDRLVSLQKAAGYASIAGAGFSAGSSVGGLTTNRLNGALGGAVSGALSGAAAGSVVPGIGTAVGAIVGGLAGAVGGLLSSAAKGNQAAAQMKLAQEQLDKSLDALRATFSNDTLGATLAQASAQFDELRKSTEAAYSGRKNEAERNRILAELNTLEAQRLAILKQEFELGQQRQQQDALVRTLRASGDASAADALAFALTQERELADARKAGATDATLLAIATAQVAEAQQRAAQIAAEIADRIESQSRTRASFVADVTARGLSLSGDSSGALFTRLTQSARDALLAASDLVKAGTITADDFRALAKVLDGELKDSLKNSQQAILDAAKAQENDLYIRTLRANGLDEYADKEARRIANEEKLSKITDEAARERERYVQGLEEERIAINATAAAIQKLKDVAATDFSDLASRIASAQSRLGLADPLGSKAGRDLLQQEELKNAQEKGYGDAYLAQIRYYYTLLDLAEAMDKANAEAEKQAKLAELQADVTDKYLRSNGQGFQADQNALKSQRDRALEEAKAAGAPSELLAMIEATYNNNLNALIASQFDKVKPLDVSPVTSGSTPRLFEAGSVTSRTSAGFSEITASSWLDLGQSQLAVLRSIDARLAAMDGLGSNTAQSAQNATRTPDPLVAAGRSGIATFDALYGRQSRVTARRRGN